MQRHPLRSPIESLLLRFFFFSRSVIPLCSGMTGARAVGIVTLDSLEGLKGSGASRDALSHCTSLSCAVVFA